MGTELVDRRGTASHEKKTGSEEVSQTFDKSVEITANSVSQYQAPWSHSSLLAYHARTIYLFNCDYHQMVVCPWTAAGIANALSGPALTTNDSPHIRTIILRVPHALLWMWLNILVSAINNQRSQSSISEDAVNKPWRPIPSGRLTAQQSRNLLLAAVPLVLIISSYLGAGNTTIAAFVLNWMYNDLGGSDVHHTIRNLINALAMILGIAGATRVAMHDWSSDYDFNDTGYQWLAVKAALALTTMQVQDLRDLEGDRSRGRNTTPIALGDEFTRWTIAIPVIFWSLFCPFCWSVNLLGYVLPLVLGSVLSVRVLVFRRVDADQITWRFWGLWTFAIFLLPLHDYLGSFFVQAVKHLVV